MKYSWMSSIEEKGFRHILECSWSSRQPEKDLGPVFYFNYFVWVFFFRKPPPKQLPLFQLLEYTHPK